MRYLVGTYAEMSLVRTALDVVAGMPYYVEGYPSPPGNPESYSPGAPGWMEHVLNPALDAGVLGGLLVVTDDALPFLGLTVEVEGAEVVLPEESALLTREQLSPAMETWLSEYENPPFI